MQIQECSIVGCDRPVKGRGWCSKHYYNFQTHGDPEYKKPGKKCGECNRKHYAKGLCRECYFKAKGTVGGAKNRGWKTCSQGCGDPVYGKGLCRKCWNRLTHAGTLDSKKVADLPGEQWKEIARPDCVGLMISSFGRVKSCRKRDERLLASKMTTINPQERQASMTVANGSGNNILVHMEILRAFHENEEGDFQAVFLDGDRSNCRADNLTWYGRGYLLDKAIKMAEESNHPLADCFLRFWHGEVNVLNDWFKEQEKRLRSFLFARAIRFSVPYYIDVDDCVQETIVKAFLALRRGMIKNLESINSWMLQIAKKTLASGVRDCLPAASMVKVGSDNGEYNSLDYAGWCHPSAELQAIGREMSLC